MNNFVNIMLLLAFSVLLTIHGTGQVVLIPVPDGSILHFDQKSTATCREVPAVLKKANEQRREKIIEVVKKYSDVQDQARQLQGLGLTFYDFDAASYTIAMKFLDKQFSQTDAARYIKDIHQQRGVLFPGGDHQLLNYPTKKLNDAEYQAAVGAVAPHIDWMWGSEENKDKPPSRIVHVFYPVSASTYRERASARQCVMNAIEAASQKKDTSLAIGWLMAGQAHNADVGKLFMNNADACIRYAVTRYGGSK